MELAISDNHRHEYPIEKFWYTKHNGHSIEYIIDHDISFFEWIVKVFQDVTPYQAEYYYKKTGRKIPMACIKAVPPYVWETGDPERLYIELCESGDLEKVLFKYRNGNQLDLF